MEENRVHSFHIPVMGLAFSIDTPVKVARFGISSVVSIVDDVLIEHMRKQYTLKRGEDYSEIKSRDYDSRARRITAYLNLLQQIVHATMTSSRSMSGRTAASCRTTRSPWRPRS